jgi:F-type H+-transporting ATPase subunit delta
VNAEITSATPLGDEQFAAIQSKLETKFKKKIKATAAVDAKLLGGFIVQVGGTIYDYSIETQLQSLGRKLASA